MMGGCHYSPSKAVTHTGRARGLDRRPATLVGDVRVEAEASIWYKTPCSAPTSAGCRRPRRQQPGRFGARRRRRPGNRGQRGRRRRPPVRRPRRRHRHRKPLVSNRTTVLDGAVVGRRALNAEYHGAARDGRPRRDDRGRRFPTRSPAVTGGPSSGSSDRLPPARPAARGQRPVRRDLTLLGLHLRRHAPEAAQRLAGAVRPPAPRSLAPCSPAPRSLTARSLGRLARSSGGLAWSSGGLAWSSSGATRRRPVRPASRAQPAGGRPPRRPPAGPRPLRSRDSRPRPARAPGPELASANHHKDPISPAVARTGTQ